MLPRWRKGTWVLVAYAALMPLAVLSHAPYAARAWVLGGMVLAVLWAASMPRRRDCSRCGSSIPQTFLVCPVCRRDSYVRVSVPTRSARDAGRR